MTQRSNPTQDPGMVLALSVIELAVKDAQSSNPQMQPRKAYRWLTTKNKSLRFWCLMADLDIVWVNEFMLKNIKQKKLSFKKVESHAEKYIKTKRRQYERERDSKGERLRDVQIDPEPSQIDQEAILLREMLHASHRDKRRGISGHNIKGNKGGAEKLQKSTH